MATLWQKLRAKEPERYAFYDPLHIPVGGTLGLDVLDYRNLTFIVDAIREYKRPDFGDGFIFAEYDIHGIPAVHAEPPLKLRCLNVIDAKPEIQPLFLQLYDQFAYTDDFLAVVNSDSADFNINVGTDAVPVMEKYLRNVKYKALVVDIKDSEPPISQPQSRTVECWDYTRMATDEAGQSYEECLCIEMNGDTGWFQLWRGVELLPENIVKM